MSNSELKLTDQITELCRSHPLIFSRVMESDVVNDKFAVLYAIRKLKLDLKYRSELIKLKFVPAILDRDECTTIRLYLKDPILINKNKFDALEYPIDNIDISDWVFLIKDESNDYKLSPKRYNVSILINYE